MKNRIIKADLHNHLQTSGNLDKLNFNKLIDTVYQRLGPGGTLGIVNMSENADGNSMHDTRYEEIVKKPGYERVDIKNGFYIPSKDILVIKGQEVPTKKGHLLVLGLEKEKHLRGRRTVEDTVKQARDLGGVIIADHPFGSNGLGEYLKENSLLFQIDGWETHNGEAALFWKANKKAKTIYDSIPRKTQAYLGAVVTSDGHSLREIGSSWKQIPELDKTSSERLSNSLKESLRYDGETKKHNSYFGALEHAGKLVGMIGLSKLGVKF